MRALSVLLAATAFSACGISVDEADEVSRSTAAVSKEAAWTNTAPGVWERTSKEGRRQRLGYGAGGLRAVLDTAHKERAQLLEHSDQRAVAAQLAKNAAIIADLEAKRPDIEAAEWRDSWEPPNSTLGASSGSVCAGGYAFDVSVALLSFVDFQVTATASWSEFGPFAPYTKTMTTHTTADGGNGFIDEDNDSTGPFSGSCCVQVSSSSIASVTFSPQLYGLAYLTVSNGCNAFRSYDENP